MFVKESKSIEKCETVQEIALKLVEEQLRILQVENGPKERTVFILGSKGVGKSTIINKFFDREDTPRPTLALEYSYARRSSPSQQVLNIWELGSSLQNAEQLIEVPLRIHGVEHFAAVIILDLTQPQRLWLDMESAYRGLKQTCDKMLSKEEQQSYRERAMETRLRRDHPDANSLDLIPFPVIIVGGRYDRFVEFDPEQKKHICRCLRSMAHLIGGAVLFYSSKVPKLSKTLRDSISHLGFGSPLNPFRVHTTDYNNALSVWFGTDSWAAISSSGALSVESIGSNLIVEVSQAGEDTKTMVDPAKDPGFQESIIDEMRSQKDEELQAIIKEAQLAGQFESVAV